MANGDPRLGLMEKAVELGQRAGIFGMIGLTFLILKEVIFLFAHFNLDNLANGLGMIGLYLAIFGILANGYRLKHMTATVAAEAKIDRTVISAQLPGPTVPPTSYDPAVQREIGHQIRNGKGEIVSQALRGEK